MDELVPGCGIAGIVNSERIGFGVDENARRLHRLAYVERRCVFIAAGHLLHTPEWEIKHLLGRHLYEDAEHHDLLRTRITELRRSDRSVDACPDLSLAALLDEALWAADTIELLTGLYQVIKPELVSAYESHLEGINPLVDYPTGRVLQQILRDEREHIVLGQRFLHALLSDDAQIERSKAYADHLRAYLFAAGNLSGRQRYTATPLPPARAKAPWTMDKRPGRDARFSVSEVKDPCLQVPGSIDQVHQGLEQMMWVRFHEMSPAETVAAIMVLQQGMPWPFYRDLARHCWDEIRHSAFGQVALQQEGIDPTTNPNWTGFSTVCLNEFDPLQAYTHLTIAVEQAAMKYPPGKRQEYEFCRDTAKHALMTLYQDHDWADEVNHAQIGQQWIVRGVYKGDRHAAIAAGEETMRRRYAFFTRYAVNGVTPDNTSRHHVLAKSDTATSY